MITVSITVATNDDLLTLAQKLSGINSANITAIESAAPAAKAAKEPTNKVKGEVATKAAAPVAAKGKRAVSLAELQDKIGEHAGGDTDKIKEFVASFGVKKISLMDDATRVTAFDGVEAFFGETEEGEEDPMA